MAEKNLEQMIQSMEDVHEIENLIGRYQYFHMGGGPPEGMSDCFVKKTDGGRLTCPLGVWVGLEGLRRWFGRGEPPREMAMPGGGIHFMLFPSTSIVLEVAGDGKTAKAVLTSPGGSGRQNPDGKGEANWFWLKAGFDFVKEDGKWKVFNYHMWEIFQTSFDRNFTEGRLHADEPKVSQFGSPDSTIPPEFLYNPKSVQQLIPEPPEPYETYDDIKPY